MFSTQKMVSLGCRPLKVHAKSFVLIKAINFTLYLCSEALLCSRMKRNAFTGDVMNGNVYQWKYLDLHPQTGLLSCGKFNLKQHKRLLASSRFSLSCIGPIQTAFSVTSLHLLWAEVFGSRTRREPKYSSFQSPEGFHKNVVEEHTQKEILKCETSVAVC